MTMCINPKTPSKFLDVGQDILFENSFHRHPKKGKCAKSTMACGYHRVGLVPVMSTLDNGSAGNICQEICIDCGKRFFGINASGFVLVDQPKGVRYPLGMVGDREPRSGSEGAVSEDCRKEGVK